MLKECNLSLKDAVCIVTITITSKIFFSSPALLADLLGNTVWYMAVLSAAAAMLWFMFVFLLLKRFPGKSIMEIFELVLGRYLGLVFSILFSAIFLMEALGSLSEFSYILKIYFFPRSSICILAAIAAVAVTLQSFLGIESLARLARLSAIVLLAAFAALLLLPFKFYDISRIFPIFGYGIDITFVHGLMRSSSYGEVLFLAVMAGCIKDVNILKRAGFLSLLSSGLLFVLSFLALTLGLPYYANSHFTSPMYELLLLAGHSLEPAYFLIWVPVSLIAMTVLFNTSIAAYASSFRIADTRPVIIPFAAIMLSTALLFSDITSLTAGYQHSLQEYTWIVLFVLPLVTLIVAVLKEKKEA